MIAYYFINEYVYQRYVQYGWSPLTWACNYGSSDIVKLLIDNGANINDKDKVSSDSLPSY